MALAKGEHILLLNNDTEISSRGWLKEMVSCLDYPMSASSAPNCFIPTARCSTRASSPDWERWPAIGSLVVQGIFRGRWGVCGCASPLTVVTGACFLITRKCLDDVGPFDEEKFAVAYNDVDFCLRAVAKGIASFGRLSRGWCIMNRCLARQRSPAGEYRALSAGAKKISRTSCDLAL
jgi:GT2 family glycosyltransferase